MPISLNRAIEGMKRTERTVERMNERRSTTWIAPVKL